MTTIAGLSAAEGFGDAARTVAPAASAHPTLREAFATCADEVYRFIFVRVGGDREAAADLLQECCRAAAGHKRPPREPDAWAGWFCGIARNLIRRHWRQRGRETRAWRASISQAARLAAEQLPESAMVGAEETRALAFAIGRLSAAEQDLLHAFYFDGRSCDAIATDLRVTVKAVENRLRRARARLRELLTREVQP